MFSHIVRPAGDAAFKHMWCCECSPRKVDWICQVMGVRRENMFTDVSELHSPYAALSNGVCAPVPYSEAFITGYSCKNVSMANPARSTFADCVEFGKGATGVTWRGAFEYAKEFLPLCLWLENVGGVRGRNLKCATRDLEAIGYCVVVLFEDVANHGIPVRRRRVWICACLGPRGQ